MWKLAATGVNGSVSVNHALTNEGEDCLGSSQSLLCLPLFSQSRTEVFVPSNSCLAFASFDAVKFINIDQDWRDRETNFQQRQLGDSLSTPTLVTRPDPLLFGISHHPTVGNLPCHCSTPCCGRPAEDHKDSDVMPTLILTTPNESRKI